LARAQPGGLAVHFDELKRRHSRSTKEEERILVRPIGREASDHPGRV